MRKTIFIEIETKNRELYGVLWLSQHFVANGWSVYVGESSEIRSFALLHKPDVMILKSCGQTTSVPSLLKEVRRNGCMLFALDVEGGVYRFDSEIGQRMSPKVVDMVELILTWGPKQKEYICQKLCVNPRKVRVTGYPSFDLLHLNNRNFFKALRPQDSFFPKPYILVNTNFGCVNSMSNNKKNKINHSKNIKRYVDAVEDSDFLSFEKANMKYFIDAIKSISIHFPKLHVVVRPHPSESPFTYSDSLCDFDNISVRSDLPVSDWIAHACCVVHNNCTTGIEAALLGKLPVAYSPIGTSGYDLLLPNTLSLRVFHLNDLLKAVASYVNGRALESIQQRSSEANDLLQLYFYRNDGCNAERVFNEVMKVYDAKPLKHNAIKSRGSIFLSVALSANYFKSILRALINLILGWQLSRRFERFRYALRFNTSDFCYKSRKFPATTPEEVESILCRFQDIPVENIHGLMSVSKVSVKVKRCARDIFHLDGIYS